MSDQMLRCARWLAAGAVLLQLGSCLGTNPRFLAIETTFQTLTVFVVSTLVNLVRGGLPAT